jgi:hypothetical protein
MDVLAICDMQAAAQVQRSIFGSVPRAAQEASAFPRNGAISRQRSDDGRISPFWRLLPMLRPAEDLEIGCAETSIHEAFQTAAACRPAGRDFSLSFFQKSCLFASIPPR